MDVCHVNCKMDVCDVKRFGGYIRELVLMIVDHTVTVTGFELFVIEVMMIIKVCAGLMLVTM